MRVPILLLLGSMVVCVACARRAGPPVVTPIGGTVAQAAGGEWEYRADNPEGDRVAEGTLTLRVEESSLISGTWHINPVGETRDIGPQIGDGRLEGYVDTGGLVHLNLNPDYADNNVSLVGTIEGDIFTGTWNYATIAGVRTSGAFRASRRD